MPNPGLPLTIILWACALFTGLLVVGMYLWTSKRNVPIPFWSGSTMKPDELTDVAGYNRANLRMWMVYAVCLALTGGLTMFNLIAGLIALGVVLIPGTILLIGVNRKVFEKYKSETGTYRVEI